MSKQQIHRSVVIDGSLITPADLDNLVDIKNHLTEAGRIYRFLSDDAQKVLRDMHSEDTWIGHLVRWGDQNCNEAIAAVLSAPAAGTQSNENLCKRTLAMYRPGVPMAGVHCSFAYQGKMPNTGSQVCHLCGAKRE